MSKWVFVHIPKTAGASFAEGIRRAFGPENVSPGFSASNLSEKDAVALDQFRVIAGHISIRDVERYFPDRRIITVLRDPVDRCVSWYYFANSLASEPDAPDAQAARRHTIEAFFGLDLDVLYRNIFNRQVRQLGSHVLDRAADHDLALRHAREVLRNAAWVGRVSSIDRDIERLKARFPEFASLQLARTNVTPSRKSIGELDGSLLSSIRRLNSYDLDLFGTP